LAKDESKHLSNVKHALRLKMGENPFTQPFLEIEYLRASIPAVILKIVIEKIQFFTLATYFILFLMPYISTCFLILFLYFFCYIIANTQFKENIKFPH
jgi:hypothetical protein